MINQWSIECVAEDLDLGFWDYLDHRFSRNSKDASHSYLVLKDEHGDIISRIDGLSYNDIKKESQFSSGGLSSYFNFFAYKTGLTNTIDHVVKSIGADRFLWRLRARTTIGTPDKQSEDREEFTVFQGDSDETLAKWLKACEAVSLINDKNYAYVPISLSHSGQNCHAVTGTALRAMSVAVQDDTSLFQNYSAPGMHDILLDDETLNSIQKHQTFLPLDAMQYLTEYASISDGLFPCNKEKKQSFLSVLSGGYTNETETYALHI